jgi:hypothetical protein
VDQSVYFVTTDWMTGGSGFEPRQRQRIFTVASVSRPALRPTHPPEQWVLGVIFGGGGIRPGLDPDYSSHLVLRSRMSRSYISSPCSLHGGFTLLYFTLLYLLYLPNFISYNTVVNIIWQGFSSFVILVPHKQCINLWDRHNYI